MQKLVVAALLLLAAGRCSAAVSVRSGAQLLALQQQPKEDATIILLSSVAWPTKGLSAAQSALSKVPAGSTLTIRGGAGVAVGVSAHETTVPAATCGGPGLTGLDFGGVPLEVYVEQGAVLVLEGLNITG